MIDYMIVDTGIQIEFLNRSDNLKRYSIISSAFEIQTILADCSEIEKRVILVSMKAMKEKLRRDKDNNERA